MAKRTNAKQIEAVETDVETVDVVETSKAVKAEPIVLNKEQLVTYSELKTKSAQIRYLSSAGFSRAQIAKHLNVRYQHVRNVLTTELKRPDSK